MTDKEIEIIKMIEAEPYPLKQQVKEEEMDKFEKTFVGTKKELEEKQKEVDETINNIYRQKRKSYYDRINELEDKLKEAVREDFDMDKKVFDIVWRKAYEKGHSDGYEEVIIEAEDLYDFVNDIIGAME